MNSSLKKRMEEENYKLVSIDLFSGPGGLCTGFKWAGILPLIAVEWVDTTVETYSTNHNAEIFELSKYINNGEINISYLKSFFKESIRSIIIHGDINLVSSSMIRDLLYYRYGINSIDETVDVVSGGAPCESFSMAGKRAANDERDDLFSNIVRISRAVKTKIILFENVNGLFSKSKDGKKGAIFEYICDTFENTVEYPSYRLASRDKNQVLLKAIEYGVPQARERVFLISIRRDLDDVCFTYPVGEYGPGKKHPYVTVADAISDLPKVESGEENTDYHLPKIYKSENQKHFLSIMRGNLDNEKFHANVPKHMQESQLFTNNSISVHKGPGHVDRKKKLLELIPERSSMKMAYEHLVEVGEFEKYKDLFPHTIYASRNRRLLWDEPSFTVTSHCLDEILHPILNRAITPREAARLQSFPDWYQFAGPYVQFHGDKEQDKYEQIGDAIPPLLAYAIAKQIIAAVNAI